MELTKHGKDRMKQRVCGKSNRQAEDALAHGLSHAEVKGSLSRYIDKLFLSGNHPNNIRIYGRNVFLFHGNVLITVVPLPTKYHSTYDKLIRKRCYD